MAHLIPSNLKFSQKIAAQATASSTSKRVKEEEALQRVTLLRLHPDQVHDVVSILWPIEMVPMRPIVASSRYICQHGSSIKE
jgi:hypothetical protein